MTAVLVLGALAAVMVPKAAQSDPISDRISLIQDRLEARGISRPLPGGEPAEDPPTLPALPAAFMCEILQPLLPPFIIELLLSLGIWPCAAASP